jgi:hypothetical protein
MGEDNFDNCQSRMETFVGKFVSSYKKKKQKLNIKKTWTVVVSFL